MISSTRSSRSLMTRSPRPVIPEAAEAPLRSPAAAAGVSPGGRRSRSASRASAGGPGRPAGAGQAFEGGGQSDGLLGPLAAPAGPSRVGTSPPAGRTRRPGRPPAALAATSRQPPGGPGGDHGGCWPGPGDQANHSGRLVPRNWALRAWASRSVCWTTSDGSSCGRPAAGPGSAGPGGPGRPGTDPAAEGHRSALITSEEIDPPGEGAPHKMANRGPPGPAGGRRSCEVQW